MPPLVPSAAPRAAAAALGIAALLASGCSRTKLRDLLGAAGGATSGPSSSASSGGGGAGGVGGSAEGGGGAGGGAGGAGGRGPCALEPTQPILGLAGGEIWHQKDPVLTRSSEDGERVTVVSQWTVVEGPASPPAELRHTTFLPWSSWPADGTIEPTYLVDYDGGYSFAAAAAPADRVSLLFARKPTPGSAVSEMIFAPEVEPGSGAVPASIAIDPSAERALFVSTRGDARLVAFERFGDTIAAGDAYQVAMGIGTSGPAYGGSIHLGCALDPMAADAVPLEGGWLLAIANGTDLGDFSCFDDGLVGLADRLQIARIAPGGAVTSAVEIQSQTTLAAVRAATRAGGAWVAWSRYGGAASITIAVIDGEGQPNAIHELDAGPSPVAGSLAAAALGERLALAWLAGGDDSAPNIEARVVDAAGRITASAAVQPEGVIVGAPAVLGSPSGDELLVAWSELPGPPSGARVRIAKLGCD